jgi:BirA family biotin operon repressor/biotin-[acetyl-CoA-carboxylase] ligase
LVESRGEAGGVARAVIGLGINWRVPTGAMSSGVDQPWTDLAAQAGLLPDRAVLAATVLNALVVALEEFERSGFAPFLPRWRALDVLNGREIAVKLDAEQVTGVATGIDDDGALLVRTPGGPRRFTAGDVSVRGLA